MAEQAPDTSSKTTARDLLVGVFGFATCLLTAVILWWIETRSGFAFYTWTFWFVIPVWAVFSGFVGASGYYAGAWVLNHRPTPLLLLNIVLASVGTFFLRSLSVVCDYASRRRVRPRRSSHFRSSSTL